MISIFDIHSKLGLNLENGLFIRKNFDVSDVNFKDLYEGKTEFKSDFKIEYALKKLQPHSFFVFNNEPLILFFESKDLNISKQTLCEQIWNFNKSALAFVNFETELVIYNGFDYDNKSNLLAVLHTLQKLKDLPEKYSYWNIVTAELWNSYDKEFTKKTRVDKVLLQNISSARTILIGKDKKTKLIEILKPEHANRLIGRLIFVRYLIDRNVNINYESEGNELLNKNDLPKLILQKEKLYNFFDYLSNKFKGNFLPINGERNAVKQEHLNLLSELFAGTNINGKQKSLFNVFDFDFIPIELVSSIYETFLGERQDADKAFYTPPFLVDYVLEQTVKPHIEKVAKLKKLSCKTVDFTCGSGIFLCETLRSLINKYIELEKPEQSSKEFKHQINQLLVKNIFGNDINKEATEIAKFSLFITLLDYLQPKDIENFEFPEIATNFFNEDVFKTELNSQNQFESKLDALFGKGKIEPDFIIGNPPWGKLQAQSPYLEYIKNRKKKENTDLKENSETIKIEISNNEFAQAFMLRLSDFSSENTVYQIIVTSKLLYNLQADKFRNYFLNHFLINEVLEISSVRHQIFAKAVGPAAIIKYQYAFGKDTKQNVIDYVSLKPNPYFAIFKSILIEKHDYKEIVQNELIKNDWLWKVLVYGHILDYRFVERLRNKKEFPVTLVDLIEEKEGDEKPLNASVGIKVKQKGKSANASHLVGLPFIQTLLNKEKKNSDLQRYYINYSSISLWGVDIVAEIRPEKYFKKPPILLTKIGFSTDIKLVASISHLSCVYTNSIYAIKSKLNDYQILKNILGLINSDLMSFYMVMRGSSIGVEREQLINKELFPFPIIQNNEISIKAKRLIVLKRLIEIHKNKITKDNYKISEYETKFQQTENELNELIYNLYKLSDTERDLISYTQEITIPILQAKNKDFKEIRQTPKLFKPYKEIEKSEIEAYINIFKEHFNKLHNGGERAYFNVKVIQSKNILACEFSIDNEKHDDYWQPEKSNENILELLVNLGFKKVSNGLFIQKDIKTLKRNSFSVAKPKQYKYWHKAIARLDVVEFMEVMLQSQKSE